VAKAQALITALVAFHCCGHKGHLAASDIFNDVSFCAQLDETLAGVANFYSHSYQWCDELIRICVANEDTTVTTSAPNQNVATPSNHVI